MILRCFITSYVQILSGFEIWDIQDLILRKYDTIKTCQWNFFKFFWVVYYRKVCKNQVEKQEVKKSKILQKLNKRDCFCDILSLIFYDVSRAKTYLYSKYAFKFLFSSFFEQNHLLNSFILGVYVQRWPKVHIFQNRNWGPFPRKEFKWKKIYGSMELVSEKTEALYAEPN